MQMAQMALESGTTAALDESPTPTTDDCSLTPCGRERGGGALRAAARRGLGGAGIGGEGVGLGG